MWFGIMWMVWMPKEIHPRKVFPIFLPWIFMSKLNEIVYKYFKNIFFKNTHTCFPNNIKCWIFSEAQHIVLKGWKKSFFVGFFLNLHKYEFLKAHRFFAFSKKTLLQYLYSFSFYAVLNIAFFWGNWSSFEKLVILVVFLIKTSYSHFKQNPMT